MTYEHMAAFFAGYGVGCIVAGGFALVAWARWSR